MKRLILASLLLLLCSIPSLACDTTCPKGQHWVWSNEKQTTGYCLADSTGGSSSVSNSNASASSNQSQNQGQQQGQTQTANGGSAKSTSTANGGNATGGTAIANGGVSQVLGSGNSSSNSSVGPISNTNTANGGNVSNSGNSSNKNVNVAAGGQGGAGGSASATGGNQSQTATSTSSNNSSGNSSSYSSTYKEAAQSTFAAAPYPTAQCFKGGGIAGGSTLFTFSANGGRIDENCAILETARNFDEVGERLAACKVKISNKYAKAAGVTLEDCMNVPVPTPAPVVLPPAPQIIVVPMLQPVAPAAPAPVVENRLTPSPVLHTVGSCKLFYVNVCYRLLDTAVLVLQRDGTARIVLTGPVESGKLVSYLRTRVGQNRIEIKLADEQNSTVLIQTETVGANE